MFCVLLMEESKAVRDEVVSLILSLLLAGQDINCQFVLRKYLV